MEAGQALTSAWHRLRTENHGISDGNQIPVVCLPEDVAPFPVWAAVGEKGEAEFLLEVPHPPPKLPPQDVGLLTFAVRIFKAHGKFKPFLKLACTMKELEPVFAQLCADVIRRRTSGTATGAAIADALAEFRQLLLPPSLSVSEHEVVGLLGELAVLEQLCAVDRSATSSWLGAEAARHDFRNGLSAIEVKASLRKQSRRVRISSLDQLDPPTGGSLHLVYLCFEHDPAGAYSVPSLLSRIRQYSHPDHLSDLEARVSRIVGNPLPDIARRTFSLKDLSAYAVDGTFPALVPARLISGALDPGLSNVTYEIDLSSADRCRLSDKQWTEVKASWGKNNGS